MANWTDIFGMANDGYNSGRQPVEIFLATIMAINPLTINLGDNKPVENEIIQCCSGVEYLKNTADTNEIGQKIVAVKALGGQTFFIVDKAEKGITGTTVAEIADVNPIKLKLCNNKIYDDKMFVFVKDLADLRLTTDKGEIGKKLLVTRSFYEDEFYVISRLEDG